LADSSSVSKSSDVSKSKSSCTAFSNGLEGAQEKLELDGAAAGAATGGASATDGFAGALRVAGLRRAGFVAFAVFLTAFAFGFVFVFVFAFAFAFVLAVAVTLRLAVFAAIFADFFVFAADFEDFFAADFLLFFLAGFAISKLSFSALYRAQYFPIFQFSFPLQSFW
jgi:hypothetical protein